MFSNGFRQVAWDSLDQEWDILIIGGGITGAGVFRRAVSSGLKTLLVEGQDFASGTSSKSSKLVHGGIRYLRSRQYDITCESVRQRERLLREAPGLVAPLGCIMPYSDYKGLKEMFHTGVIIYDLMAPKWQHRHLSVADIHRMAPSLSAPWIQGAYLYYDAIVDDARMVFRLINETVEDGGTALNYTAAGRLLHLQNGTVCGALLTDNSSKQLGEREVTAKVVINATGPQSDLLRAQLKGTARIRPLRGSHLVFPRSLLPLHSAITFINPKDTRAMFAIPWEGTTLIGTTDLDHRQPITEEPFCTQEEIDYILTAGNSLFPEARLTQEKVLSSFAGIRPIVHGDASNPSAESRRHAVLEDSGLITITGGKLTVFRVMAEDVLKIACVRLGRPLKPLRPNFKAIPPFQAQTDPEKALYLFGRYGSEAATMLAASKNGDLEQIESLPSLWLELEHAARGEAVEHLDDLLLRRVRIGMLLPQAAEGQMDAIKARVQVPLGWDETRWQAELIRYRNVYRSAYNNAPTGSI